MQDILISVIVPIYNSKKYLSECVESVLRQTYINFELLLIDDGSTDDSLKICNSFKEKDDRIKVFHHENKGVSYTRNCGISLSTGDYIAFVDADDVIMPEYLEKLLKAINSSNPCQKTISFCKFYRLLKNGNKSEYIEYYENLKEGNHNIELTINDVLTGKLFGSIWRMLIPASLIKSNNIIFSDCKVREDQLFLFELISYSDKLVECDEFLYIYRYNPESSCNIYKKDYVASQSIYLKILKEKLSNYSSRRETDIELFEYTIVDTYVSWLQNAAKSDNYYEEIKNIKASEYFNYPISTNTLNKWMSTAGKTNKVVFELAKRKLYFLIYCFFRLKKLILRHY